MWSDGVPILYILFQVQARPRSKPGGIKHSHYIGMNATSLHSRHLTHRKGHESRDIGNVMVKHEMEAHGGEKQERSTPD